MGYVRNEVPFAIILLKTFNICRLNSKMHKFDIKQAERHSPSQPGSGATKQLIQLNSAVPSE